MQVPRNFLWKGIHSRRWRTDQDRATYTCSETVVKIGGSQLATNQFQNIHIQLTKSNVGLSQVRRDRSRLITYLVGRSLRK